MQDIKITRCIVNERRELSVNLLIKEGDYSEIEAELLRQCKLSGDTIDMIISGLVNIDTEKEIKKARQCLALTMQDYCNAFHYIIDAINNDLYQKYGITSRSSLTLAQLQYEIESYRTAIRLGQS